MTKTPDCLQLGRKNKKGNSFVTVKVYNLYSVDGQLEIIVHTM